jgi:hypothetical protein
VSAGHDCTHDDLVVFSDQFFHGAMHVGEGCTKNRDQVAESSWSAGCTGRRIVVDEILTNDLIHQRDLSMVEEAIERDLHQLLVLFDGHEAAPN